MAHSIIKTCVFDFDMVLTRATYTNLIDEGLEKNITWKQWIREAMGLGSPRLDDLRAFLLTLRNLSISCYLVSFQENQLLVDEVLKIIGAGEKYFEDVLSPQWMPPKTREKALELAQSGAISELKVHLVEELRLARDCGSSQTLVISASPETVKAMQQGHNESQRPVALTYLVPTSIDDMNKKVGGLYIPDFQNIIKMLPSTQTWDEFSESGWWTNTPRDSLILRISPSPPGCPSRQRALSMASFGKEMLATLLQLDNEDTMGSSESEINGEDKCAPMTEEQRANPVITHAPPKAPPSTSNDLQNYIGRDFGVGRDINSESPLGIADNPLQVQLGQSSLHPTSARSATGGRAGSASRYSTIGEEKKELNNMNPLAFRSSPSVNSADTGGGSSSSAGRLNGRSRTVAPCPFTPTGSRGSREPGSPAGANVDARTGRNGSFGSTANHLPNDGMQESSESGIPPTAKEGESGDINLSVDEFGNDNNDPFLVVMDLPTQSEEKMKVVVVDNMLDICTDDDLNLNRTRRSMSAMPSSSSSYQYRHWESMGLVVKKMFNLPVYKYYYNRTAVVLKDPGSIVRDKGFVEGPVGVCAESLDLIRDVVAKDSSDLREIRKIQVLKPLTSDRLWVRWQPMHEELRIGARRSFGRLRPMELHSTDPPNDGADVMSDIPIDHIRFYSPDVEAEFITNILRNASSLGELKGPFPSLIKAIRDMLGIPFLDLGRLPIGSSYGLKIVETLDGASVRDTAYVFLTLPRVSGKDYSIDGAGPFMGISASNSPTLSPTSDGYEHSQNRLNMLHGDGDLDGADVMIGTVNDEFLFGQDGDYSPAREEVRPTLTCLNYLD